jgi:hypothetical protein
MPRSATDLLKDVRAAAGLIVQFTAGRALPDYSTDALMRSAVERQFIPDLDVGVAPSGAEQSACSPLAVALSRSAKNAVSKAFCVARVHTSLRMTLVPSERVTSIGRCLRPPDGLRNRRASIH